MIDRELASIAKFVLNNSVGASPYYYSVPEKFGLPAVYFPVPEVESDGETLGTFNKTYTWFINFFHGSTQEAYTMANNVINAILRERCCVDIIDEDGVAQSRKMRLNNPGIKIVDSGAVQLTISWIGRYPYAQDDSIKMAYYSLTQNLK